MSFDRALTLRIKCEAGGCHCDHLLGGVADLKK